MKKWIWILIILVILIIIGIVVFKYTSLFEQAVIGHGPASVSSGASGGGSIGTIK